RNSTCQVAASSSSGSLKSWLGCSANRDRPSNASPAPARPVDLSQVVNEQNSQLSRAIQSRQQRSCVLRPPARLQLRCEQNATPESSGKSDAIGEALRNRRSVRRVAAPALQINWPHLELSSWTGMLAGVILGFESVEELFPDVRVADDLEFQN